MHGIERVRPASRGLAITTIALGTSISTLANTITSIALPTMAHDLGASPSSSIWIVNAYQLVVTVSLLPLASLGDIYGYRIVYLSGLCLFTLASFCCGFADSLPLLVAFRALQALGAAGIHERQFGVGPTGIPTGTFGSRYVGDDAHGRCVLGGRPVGRRRDPVGRGVAMAVPGERAIGTGGDLVGLALGSRQRAGGSSFRQSKRHPQRAHIRTYAVWF